MTRKELAASCPDSEIEIRLPKTIGDMRDELIERGIIDGRRKNVDVLYSYSQGHVNKLRCLLRYEYADDMIKAGTQK